MFYPNVPYITPRIDSRSALSRLHSPLERPAFDPAALRRWAPITRAVRRHLGEPLYRGLLCFQPGASFVVDLGIRVYVEHGGTPEVGVRGV